MKIRSLVSLFLMLFLALSWLPATADAASAVVPTLEVDVPASITVPENDGYVICSFTPTRTGFYNLVSYSDSDPFAVLLDENANELAYNDDGGENRNFSLYALLVAGRNYYFGMAFYTGEGGTFDVSLSYLGEPVPAPLEPDCPVTVSVTEEAPIAFYTFTPAVTGRYILRADSQGNDTLCYLYDSEWNYLGNHDDTAESLDFCLEAELTAGETYCYALRLYKTDSAGSFSILLTQPANAGTPGDLNQDGEVDIFDANLVVAYYNGTATLTPEQLAAADVNGDEEVDIFDANLIVSYYNGTISAFPNT